MALRFAPLTSETYTFPLMIRHLLEGNALSTATQEIVYRGTLRLTYGDLRQRIAGLAGMLSELGVEQGTVVAMLDWDSHRFLEAYLPSR